MAFSLAFAGCGLPEPEPGAAAQELMAQEPDLAGAAAAAAFNASHDTGPRPALAGADRAELTEKERLAKAAYEAKRDPGSISVESLYASKILGWTQQGQQTGYWCGPASVVEALALKGQSWTQSSAAAMLRTTTDGTAFYGINAAVPNPTGYPIRDTLNYRLNTTFYEPIWLPYSPTATDVSNFKARVTFDIDNGWPTIGNAWEAPGGPHLTGHPANLEIFHWIAINGYGSWGDTTTYEDSATTVWSSVPAYTSGFNTGTMVTILGGRGYIW